MSFITAGDHPVTIVETMIAESTLSKAPGAVDVCLKVQTDDGAQSDWYRMSVNQDYSKISNRTHMTNAQVTAEKLKELGFTGNCLSQLDTMLGIKTTAHVEPAEYQGKTYMNIKYLGGGGYTPKKVDVNVQQLSSMMFGAPVQQQQAAPQQQVAGGFQQQATPQAGGFGNGGFQQQPVAGGFQQQVGTPNFNQ